MKIVVRYKVRIPDCRPVGVSKAGLTMFNVKTRFDYYVNGVPHYVPSGFIFDGASIPWGLRNSFSPTDTRYLGAAAIHDYLYATHYYPQRECDDVFLAALEASGQVGRAKMTAMYWAVRLFGGGSYRKDNTPLTIKYQRELSGIEETRTPLYTILRSV